MTKEKLQARKDEAAKARDEAIARVNALGGIISECDHWLAELDKPVPQPKERAKRRP